MQINPLQNLDGYDMTELNRALDIAKTKAFVGNSGAFLGPLMCNMDFVWTKDVETAATDGVTIWWNPDDFLKLTPGLRASTLLHELWHPGNLTFLRQGDRDPRDWNIATDYDINNGLKADGHEIAAPWFIWDDKFRGMTCEQIYDVVHKPCAPQGSGGNQGDPNKQGSGGQGQPKPGGTNGKDMIAPASPEIQAQAINNVIQAMHTAVASGNPGAVPGVVVETINKFLNPIVPWHQLLARFFSDRYNDDYSYQKRNRRYPDIYMPGLQSDNRLVHGIIYQDVSGSVSQAESIRFNSELKHIKDQYNPEKLTVVQFDTKIQEEKTFTENDPFDEIKIVGRGGTCLKCVREHIMKHQPDFVIIFSDMYVAPMQPGPKCPILWIAVGNPTAKVPFGQIIHIPR